MKTTRGTSYNKAGYFEYEINGRDFWVQGEMHYNKARKRYEHMHTGARGGETLVFWTEKEFTK